MNALPAYCGLVCEICPLYLATREPDAATREQMRVEIARLCHEQYGWDLAPAEIGDCDGCRTEHGSLFPPCRACAIRACARERGYETCAACPAYACERLAAFFASDPEARDQLDALRGAH
jgi:hypothetical protein